LIKSQMLYRLS